MISIVLRSLMLAMILACRMVSGLAVRRCLRLSGRIRILSVRLSLSLLMLILRLSRTLGGRMSWVSLMRRVPLRTILDWEFLATRSWLERRVTLRLVSRPSWCKWTWLGIWLRWRLCRLRYMGRLIRLVLTTLSLMSTLLRLDLRMNLRSCGR